MSPRPTAAALLSLAMLLAAAAGAEVRLEVLPDGTKVIRGEGTPPRPPVRVRRVPSEDLDRAISETADRLRVDPGLVRAIIQVESDYDPRAQSHKGAMGLMQLMPATAAQLAVRDPWDPVQNLRGGVTYLRELLERFGGRTELALAGYNAGPEAVRRHGGVPPFAETRDYVEKVLRLYRGDPDLQLETEERPAPAPPVHLYRDAEGRLVISNQPGAQR